MRCFRCRPHYAAFLAIGLACAHPAQAEVQPPKIAPARHFQFTPQPGTAWYLDGTTDGVTWTAQAGPFFATGATVNHFQRTGGEKSFRLRYVDPASVGHAPAVLSGTSLAMEKDGKLIEVAFINPVRGILRLGDAHAASFTYTWVKTSTDEGEAILTGEDGTLRLLRLRFKDYSLGRWGMEDIPNREAAARIKQTLDTGAFSFHEGRFRRNPDAVLMPATLASRSVILNEGGLLTHLIFTGAAAATMTTPKGSALECTYSYDPESNAHGELHLNLPNGTTQGFRLDLNAPGLGSFTGIPAPGGPSSPRFGTFTIPVEQNPPLNPNCPPQSIAGSSFLIRDSTPVTLTFLADGTGYTSKDVNGTIHIVGFFYSYSNTGGGTARVSLVFPGGSGDAVDDYEMVWYDDCTGEFTRESFTNGSTTSSARGTFGPGTAAGGFGGEPPPGLGM